MKVKFEQLQYQIDAVQSIIDLFKGQEECATEFTLSTRPTPGQTTLSDSALAIGIGNEQKISEEELLKNLNEIQERNGLLVTSLRPIIDAEHPPSFSIDMETGTGKTFVYTKAIFELNKQYGFKKFIIVVPSIAVKEGVSKSLEDTKEHFRTEYAGENINHFVYDSNRLEKVRNFALSSHIQVMIMTVGSINKKGTNKIYQSSEKVDNYIPLELIQSTKPILIIDEPQSVDGGLGGKGKEALDSLSALCTLRFSATHRDKHPVIYRLDPVDAYELELVKQIEISSAQEEGVHNEAYIKLLGINMDKVKGPTAQVELDCKTADGIKRKEVEVDLDSDLEEITGLNIYSGIGIKEINSDIGLNIIVGGSE